VKYIVDVDGRRIEVVIDGDGVQVDGVQVRAHLADVEGTPAKLVTIGDSIHRVIARRIGKGQYVLRTGGYRFAVEALDERTRTVRDLTAAAAGQVGPAPLRAPMPGLIVRVLVSEGDQVQPAQGLIVMEAMKMENELRASGAGRIRTIQVQAGQAVEKGALLVELE
jgi:biotin carboxyl carrier protein